jgi:hypothetical protein
VEIESEWIRRKKKRVATTTQTALETRSYRGSITDGSLIFGDIDPSVGWADLRLLDLRQPSIIEGQATFGSDNEDDGH